MKRVRVIGMLMVATIGGCGGEEQGKGATFEFKLRGMPDGESFRVLTQDVIVIEQIRAQLGKPVADRKQFPIGTLARNNGGYNLDWGWHLTDVRLTEMAIELCDATPSHVQANLDEWMARVRSFCPWSAYVVAEVQ